MKNFKILRYLCLILTIVFTQQLTAQVTEQTHEVKPGPQEMRTLFEDFYRAEGDIDKSAPHEKDEAWAGAETSDGGLLVVGSIDNSRAFISRYTFTGTEGDYSTSVRKTLTVEGWRRIMDIKSIGNDQYLIVGWRAGNSGGTNGGLIPSIGIAIITDLGAGLDNFFSITNFFIIDGPSFNNYSLITNTLNNAPNLVVEPNPPAQTPDIPQLTLFSQTVPSAIVQHGDGTNNTYSVLLHHETDFVVFVLNFSLHPTLGLKVAGVSEGYVGLRWPHAISACGNYLIAGGQGFNNANFPQQPPSPPTLEEPFVMASWSINDLSDRNTFVGIDNLHKTKMVACAGAQGVIAFGGFDNPGDGSDLEATMVNSFALFPDPSDLNGTISGVLPLPPTYLNNEMSPFTNNNPWPTEASYAQAVAPRSTGGWILAGQVGGTDNDEDMVAMIVNSNTSFSQFNVSHYTEVLEGDPTTNGTNFCFANYVIQLSTLPGQPNRYALFGKANWRDITNDPQGNSYVVIVSE